MPVESIHCPNCGASLPVTSYMPMTTCTYCHSTIRIIAGELGVSELTPEIAHPAEIAKSLSRFFQELPAENDQLTEITYSLTTLLQRSNDDAFVIFAEKKSQKFVQFSGKEGNPLILDLPSQTLSSNEMERATKFFRDLGAGGAKEMGTYSDLAMTKFAGTYITFNLELGQDVELAARITLAIFRLVFQFPVDFQLVITDN